MAWSDIFLPSTAMTADEQAANYNRLQAEYEARLQARLDANLITQEDYDSRLEIADAGLDSQNLAALGGALEGATEIVTNPSQWAADTKEGGQMAGSAIGTAVGAVGQGLGSVVWGALRNIPWWIFAAAIAAAFFYLGGLDFLRRKLKEA